MFQAVPWLRLNWLPLVVFTIASLWLIRVWRSRGLMQRLMPWLAAGGRIDLRAMATFAQTFGELLQLGYSLQDAVRTSANGCRRPTLRMAAQQLAKDFDAGRPPSESSTSMLPPLLFLGMRLEPSSQAHYFQCLGQMYYERWLFAAQRSLTSLSQFAFFLFLALVALAVFVLFLPFMMLLKGLTGFGALLIGIVNLNCFNSDNSVPYLATSLLGWLTIGKFRSWWRLNRIWKPNAKRPAQCSLLAMLELAYDPKMSQASQLAPGHGIELYGQEETGRHRRRTMLLAKRLQSGTPLVDALEQTPDVLDDQSVLAIRLAVQSGTLPATLRQLKTDLRSDWLADQHKPQIAWRYYLGLLLALIGIIAFIRAWIVPQFAEINQELTLQPTGSFRWLESGSLVSLLFYLPGVLACVALSVWIAGRLGWVRWFSRSLGSYVSPRQRQLRRSRLIGLIASNMRAGRPAAGVMTTLSKYHHDPRIRHQLLVCYRELTGGQSLPESLKLAGLLGSEQSQALGTLDTNSQQGWLLANIADRLQDDVIRTDRLLASIIHPAVICVYGLFVLWVCVGIFSMLAKLMAT
jgi:type II secretory pathway component PulF